MNASHYVNIYQISNVFIRQNTTTLNVIIHISCVSLLAFVVNFATCFGSSESHHQAKYTNSNFLKLLNCVTHGYIYYIITIINMPSYVHSQYILVYFFNTFNMLKSLHFLKRMKI
jgi:hypothetical protein